MTKRLRRIHSELSLLGFSEDASPIYESQSSVAELCSDDSIGPRVRKGIQHSLICELDGIINIKNDHELRRRALLVAIADVQQSLKESKGQRRAQLQGTLMQLRSKQRLLNYETDACDSMQKQLQLACRSRHLRAQKLYEDIKSVDARSAQLISSRWIKMKSSAPTSFDDVATNGDAIGSTDNRFKSTERFIQAQKTPLAASIEQLLSSAIAATTPRFSRPNQHVEFGNSS